MIDFRNARSREVVYVVSFYDGYIDGCKYNAEAVNTTYVNFVATVGTKYFATFKAADNFAKKLNLKQLEEAKA